MPSPVALYAAAGALAAGGVGGGSLLLQKAQREAAKDIYQTDQKAVREVLEGEIQLEELRERAREKGIDPDGVEHGYHAVKNDQIGFEEVLEVLGTGASGKKPSNSQ
jgi:hypothetical protein